MVSHLRKAGCDEEGLYRKEGPISERRELVDALHEGYLPKLDDYSIHSVSAVLKHVRNSLIIFSFF